jgi:chromosome partitioning protein
MTDDKDLLGLSEVAELLSATRQTVTNWRQRREDFPDPLVELRSGPIWNRAAIAEWAQASGLDLTAADEEDDSARPRGRGTTVALMNMKGGVGKSTLAANLGWFGAYTRDMRVLLVDLDPQFNLSQYVLGTAKYEEHLDAGKKTVLDIFEQVSLPAASRKAAALKIQPAEVIANIRTWRDGSRLDLLPSSLELAFTLRNPTGKELLLKYFLDEVRESYDLILIDCPPTESILTHAAYHASEAVLIPVKPEFLSTIGLPLIVKSLEEFSEVNRKELEVLGIVFNASAPKLEDDRSRSFVRQIAKQEGWTVFRHAVSQSDSYPKGSRYGTPIFLTDHARSTKIKDFEAVAEEFFKKLEQT